MTHNAASPKLDGPLSDFISVYAWMCVFVCDVGEGDCLFVWLSCCFRK